MDAARAAGDAVGRYLGEVSSHSLLDADEEVHLAREMEAGRRAQQRLDELVGIDAAERKAAREWSFQTTALALAVEPGMVISITHPDAPGGGPVLNATARRPWICLQGGCRRS